MSWRDRDLDREIENLHAKCERLQAQQRSRSAASDWTVILSRLDVGFAKLEACYVRAAVAIHIPAIGRGPRASSLRT
jgi:hypothetical protein